MFGGYGFYAGDVFFAILHRGRFYLFTDDAMREQFIRLGSVPFRTRQNAKLMRYYEVPAEILENASRVQSAAESAIRARVAARPAVEKIQKTRKGESD